MSQRAHCPRCKSDEYGYDLKDESQPDTPTNRYWSCLHCKLGITPDPTNRGTHYNDDDDA